MTDVMYKIYANRPIRTGYTHSRMPQVAISGVAPNVEKDPHVSGDADYPASSGTNNNLDTRFDDTTYYTT